MKAALYLGEHQLVVKDIPIPEPGPNEVRVRVAYCGVCGTDVHIYHGDGGAADVTPPLIIGHEFSGVVDSVGSSVTKLKVGDRVSVNPNDMCGECWYCHNGMEHFCEKYTGIGTTVNGGFAEYCVASESTVYKVGDMDLISAAMVEPLSCCIRGIDLCGIRPGNQVLIVGGGPIGLIMAQLAKLSGATVILSEPSHEKRDIARHLGADMIIDPIHVDIPTFLRKNDVRLSHIIECVGSPALIEQTLEWAGKGAVIMLFGLTGPEAEITIKPDVIFKKELRITSSFINPYTYGRAIELLKTKKVDVTNMIKNIISLEELENALASDTLRKQGKVMVKL